MTSVRSEPTEQAISVRREGGVAILVVTADVAQNTVRLQKDFTQSTMSFYLCCAAAHRTKWRTYL